MDCNGTRLAFAMVMMLMAVRMVEGRDRECRPRGCGGVVFRGTMSSFTQGSFAEARCGGSCNVMRRCRGKPKCKIASNTTVTWSPDRYPPGSIVGEEVERLTSRAVGRCRCRCKRKFRTKCKARGKPDPSVVARQVVVGKIGESAELKKVRKLMAYNNLYEADAER